MVEALMVPELIASLKVALIVAEVAMPLALIVGVVELTSTAANALALALSLLGWMSVGAPLMVAVLVKTVPSATLALSVPLTVMIPLAPIGILPTFQTYGLLPIV